MTVKELIEQLSKFRDDQEVYFNVEEEFELERVHSDCPDDDYVWIEGWYK